MRKAFALAVVGAIGLGALFGAVAFLAAKPPDDGAAAFRDIHPAWTETKGPFPIDQWGTGKAFDCKPADCGAEVKLFLRAKIGFCNCTTGVADDEELERVGDLDLIGSRHSAAGPGRPIRVAWMNGRSRPYSITSTVASRTSALAMAFNEHCDVIVATVAVGRDQPAALEQAVIAFLNGDQVLRWAELTLGL